MVIDKIVHVLEASVTPAQIGYSPRRPLYFVFDVKHTQTASKTLSSCRNQWFALIRFKYLDFLTQTLHGKQVHEMSKPVADKRSGYALNLFSVKLLIELIGLVLESSKDS